MADDQNTRSLPINFTQDFLPELRLLARLLSFAADNGVGDKQSIGEDTGIPTGKSSGKVEPMIHYANAMGLIQAQRNAGTWTLGLTSLGEIVISEDRYLSEPLTLWMMHLMICRRNRIADEAKGIADPWFALFAEGELRLGKNFSQNDYLSFLEERHGKMAKLGSLSRLILRSYQEKSCFGKINALVLDESKKEGVYSRNPAPLGTDFFPAYAAYFLLVWDALYAGVRQLEIDDFFSRSRFLAVLGWNKNDTARWFDWMADRGEIQLDRQTGKTLALRLGETDTSISNIYSELV
jgi:hypothetical protein